MIEIEQQKLNIPSNKSLKRRGKKNKKVKEVEKITNFLM